MIENVPEPPPGDLTAFLNALGHGDDVESARLMPVILAELRAIAEASLNGERPGHTLQPTALVNEVFLRLFRQSEVEWQGRVHFYVVAARAMRRLLVDHARRRRRGGLKRSSETQIDEAVTSATGIHSDLIDLDAALDELATLDNREAKVIELRYFGGLEVDEVANVLGISKSTVEREWRSARAWLARRLNRGA